MIPNGVDLILFGEAGITGGGNSISIYYGRLHAPNEETTMIWNGEECHCWHRFELALHFLDGRTPEYASKRYTLIA